MRLNLPRKMKKRFKKLELSYDTYTLEKLSWAFNKRMVIARNYIVAGIPYTITKEVTGWINNGLLTDGYWQRKFKI